MSQYPSLLAPLLPEFPPYRWLVTGAAGFIGSHLAEALLALGQEVTALDDLSTGHRENLDLALSRAGAEAAGRFRFIQGSITDPELCAKAVKGAGFVLHLAALASVPDSVARPVEYSRVNVEGFLNVLEAARAEGVRRVVYSSSSAVYGDAPGLPKGEGDPVRCLSPYALTKSVNEVYAALWTRLYGLDCVGLRYFNVFGPRQDPNGAYAAVIPRWMRAVRSGDVPVLYGDGTATRDFCPVQNVVLANLLAALSESPDARGNVFNVACGLRMSLNELLALIGGILTPGQEVQALRQPPRAGDILHSFASIDRARQVLGYRPVVSPEEGLREMARSLF